MESINRPTRNDLDEKEVSLQDYLRIMYRGKWIIAISFLVVMLVTVYVTFTTPPQYEATTLLMLAGRAGQTSELFQNPWMPSNYLKVNNEIEVLKSYALARNVIKTLKRYEYADSLYILGEKKYEQRGLKLPDVGTAVKKGLKNLLSGNAAVEVVLDTLDRALVKSLRESMKVEPIRDTEAIRLTVTSVDPNEAALLANMIARVYYRMDLDFNRAEVVEIKDFVEEQLDKIEKDLTHSEEALKQFQETEDVYGLDATAQTLIDQLSTFEATYYTTLADLEVSLRRQEQQEETLNAREKSIVEETMNTTQPIVMELRTAIAELEARKINAMKTSGIKQNDPGITEVDARISDLRQRLVLEAQKISSLGLSPAEQSQISVKLLNDVLLTRIQIIALQTQGTEYKKLVDLYLAELNRLPERSLRYARLDRDRQVNEKYYVLMKTKLQESKISEAGKMSNIRIVDPAIAPTNPVKPKKKMNLLLGMFLGLGLGIGIAFVRDYLDHSVRTTEDLQKMGLSTISIIPEIDVKTALERAKTESNGRSDEASLQSRMISYYDPKSSVAEAYRGLRTNIQFMNPDKPIHSLVISSPGPGDGKSTTVINIAITFANLGKKTILIDCDLRKPILHKVFNISRNPGLTDVMKSETSIDIIRQTEIPNLDIITSGDIPPNPSEILASQKLKNFLTKVSENYDIVLLDSPPIIAVTDAIILSKITDAIILVVKANSTDLRIVERSIDQLSQVNCILAGAVLNGINVSGRYDSYYYYYRYYHYYSDGSKQQKSRKKRRHQNKTGR